MGLDLGKIKTLIEDHNITQEELGRRIGVSRQSIGNMIKKNSTKSSTLQKIADVFGVNLSYFYSDVPEDAKASFFLKLREAELQNEIDFLKQQLQEKSDYIEMLKQEIERLKGTSQK